MPSFDFEKILLEKTQKNAVALEHKFIPFIFTTFCPYLGNDHISSYYHQMCGTPPAAIDLWLFVHNKHRNQLASSSYLIQYQITPPKVVAIFTFQ